MYTLKYSLILLLFPAVVLAQQNNKEVSPVYSDEYHRLISSDTTALVRRPPSFHDTLDVNRMFSPETRMRNIYVRNHRLQMQPDYPGKLLISGNYTASFALKTVNQLPSLQKDFVQGRSQQGALVWQGPETNEVFSYGPTLASLEFNGQPYPYDINGKLVPLGSGSGHNANAYVNNIFRTGNLFSQSFNLKAAVLENFLTTRELNISMGHSSENTFIRNHNNYTKNLDVSLGATKKWLHLLGKYSYAQDDFSNANRNGFLNRTYQQSILTPISFDNAQGYTLGAGQRSYSHQADNPGFLLHNNDHYFQALHQQGSLLIKRNEFGKIKYQLTQSFDHKTENSNEDYKPGSAAFPDGRLLQRSKEDKLYQLKAVATGNIWYPGYSWHSSFTANYIFSEAHTAIRYQAPYNHYLYQRSAHEVTMNYLTYYDMDAWRFDLGLGNKIYASNTTSENNYFLPMADLSVKYKAEDPDIALLLKSSFARFNTELPVSNSLAYVNLLRYSTQTAERYFPVQEVSGFDHLAPVQHKDWTGSISADYKSRITFTAGVFSRKISQDLFPIYENNTWILKNLGNHRTNGMDLELKFSDINKHSAAITGTHTLSFLAYKNKVTAIYGDGNFTPLSGFSDVHTALVKGRPLGMIMGSTWQRDAAGNRGIGPDGFPLVAKDPAIIGNPNPDFVMKLTNMLRWKQLTLQAVFEWKKGGDRWNGTQAVLDYYGRSQQSAKDRNITGYIFPGVQMNGSPNNIPVDFYNPKLPLEDNRWVRYGYSGVAADYMEKADWLRLSTLKLSYQQAFRHIIQQLILTAYLNNIMLWTPYSGADPEQLLFDQPSSTGLDFFNLPTANTFGFNVTLQF